MILIRTDTEAKWQAFPHDELVWKKLVAYVERVHTYFPENQTDSELENIVNEGY